MEGPTAVLLATIIIGIPVVVVIIIANRLLIYR